ncbi:hypothetical protein D3C86_2204140 [compost metagenome]
MIIVEAVTTAVAVPAKVVETAVVLADASARPRRLTRKAMNLLRKSFSLIAVPRW